MRGRLHRAGPGPRLCPTPAWRAPRCAVRGVRGGRALGWGERGEGWAGCSPGIGALQCSQVLAQLPIWSGISSALPRLSEEQEEEEDEEEKEQRQSGSQRTPLPGGNRGARTWGAAHAPGAMAEAGEGGEDEIQFLRTVSLRGRAGEAAGRWGGARRSEEGLRCAAVRGAFSALAGCRGGPATYRGATWEAAPSPAFPLFPGPPPLTLRSPTGDDSLSGQLATWSETFDAQTSSWAWLVIAQTQKIRGATRPASCHLHTLSGPFSRSSCPQAVGDRQERSQWGRGERGTPCPETDACSWWQYWDCSEGNSPSPVPLLSL